MATRDARPPPALAGAPTAEELAERALRRLLRGGSWEALANEIAWEAVRSTGVESSCLAWLPGLVEATLAQRIDGLEYVLDSVRYSAREEHLGQWPHDLVGAETAATLAADEAGAQRLSRLYLDVLEWALQLLRDRLAPASNSQRPRLPRLRRERPPADPEVPELIADPLLHQQPRYGWEDRPKAA
jgi:hypothetical protein